MQNPPCCLISVPAEPTDIANITGEVGGRLGLRSCLCLHTPFTHTHLVFTNNKITLTFCSHTYCLTNAQTLTPFHTFISTHVHTFAPLYTFKPFSNKNSLPASSCMLTLLFIYMPPLTAIQTDTLISPSPPLSCSQRHAHIHACLTAAHPFHFHPCLRLSSTLHPAL